VCVDPDDPRLPDECNLMSDDVEKLVLLSGQRRIPLPLDGELGLKYRFRPCPLLCSQSCQRASQGANRIWLVQPPAVLTNFKHVVR
jgi:hypothetical protein